MGHGDSGVPCRGNQGLSLPQLFTVSWSGALKVARYSGTIAAGIISSTGDRHERGLADPPKPQRFASLIRIGRLAVVHKAILEGTIGEISTDRLTRIKNRLSDWLISK